MITTAGAKQLSFGRTSIPLTDVRLLDQDGRASLLLDDEGRPVLVDFIYTRRLTLCSARR